MKKGSRIRKIFSLAAVLSCIASLSAQSVSEKSNANLEPVRNFELERYLGKWYEIGRFDFKWEKNLKNVTADYSLNKNGTVKVVNSGYDYVSKEQKQSVGKAKFAGNQNSGSLKVSFFWSFYSDYKIIALDSEYNYALVAGANKKLLWILSRTKTIPADIKENYIQTAQNAGYDLSGFVWTEQE
ncbi:MAG: lipocalin family protein [Treponema succinifaciens]|nr:MAG: lipocalin family protein [Treponema succinifaciens]